MTSALTANMVTNQTESMICTTDSHNDGPVWMIFEAMRPAKSLAKKLIRLAQDEMMRLPADEIRQAWRDRLLGKEIVR